MHLYLGLILSALVLFMSGCGPIERKIMFNEQEFKSYAEKGTATIFGDAFLKTAGGEVRKAAGNTILLLPANSYTTEWINHNKRYMALQLTPADPRYFKYERQTTGDADGRFEFNELPPGQYYVATKIIWKVPSGGGGLTETGGWVSAMIQIASGEKKKVVVTDQLSN